jgi:L-lactate dehydrogenase complex protein LldG
MSEPREAFLSRVRRALDRDDGDAAEATRRLAERPRGPVPRRGQLAAGPRIALFQQMAEEASATVARLASPAEIPGAISTYLAQENLPAEIRLAPDPALAALPWSDRPLLAVTSGISDGAQAVSVTRSFAAVAETGTLALVSGPDTPTTLNLLPDTCIVVLPAGAVVGTYEEIWTRLRARFGDGVMPRTLNFITGPSRSADIEQKLQMGAHGPRRLHILLVDVDDLEPRDQASRETRSGA